MSNKRNKILIVIFLTLLIWAWAYMSLEKSNTFTGALKIADSTDPGLLVTFSLSGSRPQIEVPLTSIDLKGPPSQLSDLEKRLDFYYDAQEEGTTEGTRTLDLLKYLQDHSIIHAPALTLTSCSPSQVDVTVEQLEKKPIPIQCLDESGSLVPGAVPDPARVEIYVKKGYNDPATVTLTKQQIDLARRQPVSVRPYVGLGVAGVTRESEEPVNVTIQSEELLKQRSFQTTKPVGIIMSPELESQYKVTILNDDEIRAITSIFATEEALLAYQNVAYPFLVEVKANDVIDLSQIPPKQIVYNFPPEYVRSGEIELDSTKLPRYAKLKIERINSE